MQKIEYWQVLNAVLVIGVLVVNTLANTLPINGQSTGEISDRFDILFVPAGYVFSIWGVIYLGLILFAVYQALPKSSGNATLAQLSPYFWLSCIGNIAWIFLWHYEFFFLTIVAMLLLLCSLVMVHITLRQRNGLGSGLLSKISSGTFGIYLGWVSVATIANASQVLYFYDWSGWGISEPAWAVVMLVVATVLGAVMRLREEDMPFVLVLIWAFIGIALKQSDFPFVSNTAWGVAAVLVLVLIIAPFLKMESSEK